MSAREGEAQGAPDQEGAAVTEDTEEHTAAWRVEDRPIGRFQKRMRWMANGDVIWPDWRLDYRS